MAQKFGGKFSPDGGGDGKDSGAQRAARNSFEGTNPDAAGARSNGLFAPAIVLVATTFSDGAIPLAVGLIGAGALTLSAWLLRSGLRAEAEYNARKIARRPALPRKMMASVLTGIGCALAVIAHLNSFDILSPLIFGLAGLGLHMAAFGLDPMKNKGMEGIDTFQQDRVSRVVDEAESHLAAMSDAILRAGDRGMEKRVEQFQRTARELFRTVEEDPRDLTAARKYMGVYLRGAKDASVKFADIYARTGDVKARADYAALLDDLEQNFSARTRKMLLDDRSDLNVEIEVLRERLQREGVRPS
ncbi:5-bromo-4-chloroindolyl phosphate hydrolysis family protein [Planktotalea arctica]|uniref:5-bromo-4-chloroindolyl phosphate hydrolysis family protein n=1 Tax=Planktotalea arctica TaxID=1481893 RepID=UPI000A1779F1|nr:5-bromo-4-chloroindolyl phosphate hydrolysis family protein [Planktotalea arctica]